MHKNLLELNVPNKTNHKTSMPKILILTNNLYGLYCFRFELISTLIEKNIDVIISSPIDYRKGDFEALGCMVIETAIDRRGTNIFSDIKLLLNYFRLIKKIKPDIVLTYTIKPNIYGGLACKFLNIPQIATITGLGTAVENKGILQKIAIQLYRIGLSKTNMIFFQNNENLSFFRQFQISNRHVRLIPGSGVNLKKFQPLDYPSEQSIEFVFIGRIMKEKGIDHYLKAASYFRNKYPNTTFHVVGECEENYSEILKYYEENSIIKYHGFLKNVKEIIMQTHCTIHPSYYPEGMSNVLLECAACARPLISTNRSGCREIIDEGINGYLIEPNNSNDLIKKIHQFISLNYNQKIKMAQSSRIKAEKEFDRQIVVDAYLEVINKNFKSVS